ncbi:hypothetical protein IHO40_02780 [Wolbachia endosymbiont of Mansonella ozzardi]|uniref:hypothetical protein n=1 Tax=Wolbachia endosymbiont of Mansonella ozzardi TaxID=137464 RepID=UPI001CE100A9|nr:hypothetical protein [Wolbachia endosymbiont of Mansonella ozzardi]MCA4775035.1 hypothetical protein [Wolbachia endosymbiont of Mansonella ozzardi]
MVLLCKIYGNGYTIEHITTVNTKKLKQLGYPYKIEYLQSNTTVYEYMEKNISSTLRQIYNVLISYDELENSPNDEAIENLAKRFRKSIENIKNNRVMFGIQYHIDVFKVRRKVINTTHRVFDEGPMPPYGVRYKHY